MEDKLDLPENKLRAFIQGTDKDKWRANNNHNIKYFTEEEIKGITSDYSTRLGNGSFGQVYKGTLDDNRVVAVKKYNRVDSGEEFAKEVIVHSQINHKNVVRLIGCCVDTSAPMMVFEYVPNGTLEENLHGGNTFIPLDTRLGIAIQCADALWSMHSMYNPVVHGDIKPSNILLDDSFHAKVSDFGISRLLAGENTQHTKHVIGSFGYMDPVLYQEGRLTTKSDVYSLGVVLLELITGKKAISGEFNLVKRFTQAFAKGKSVRKLFDYNIAAEKNMKIVEGIGKIAKDCLEEDTHRRPEMNDVAARLRELKRTLDQGSIDAGWRFFSGGQNTIKKEDQHDANDVGSSSVLSKMTSLSIFNWRATTNFRKNGGLLLPQTLGMIIFTKEELKKITKDFTDCIGNGGFGCVYRGTLNDGTLLAVKPSILVGEDNKSDFVQELDIQTNLIHKNILRFWGCCVEVDIPLLVYEYAHKGSLRDILHGKSSRRLPLPLGLRLDIAIGAAEGLRYMHSHASGRISHGDVKPSNILLDESFNPKIDVSWLAKLLYTHQSDVEVGSMSYMDPVLMKTGILSEKSDVYGLGTVLLELITRKQVVYDENCSLLVEFLMVYEKEHSGRSMFDKDIANEEDMYILEEIGKLAIHCLKEDSKGRPDMAEVAEQLRMLRRNVSPSHRSGRQG